MAQLRLWVKSPRTHFDTNRWGQPFYRDTRNEVITQPSLEFKSGERLSTILGRAYRQYPHLRQGRNPLLVTSNSECQVPSTFRPHNHDIIEIFVGYWPD